MSEERGTTQSEFQSIAEVISDAHETEIHERRVCTAAEGRDDLRGMLRAHAAVVDTAAGRQK